MESESFHLSGQVTDAKTHTGIYGLLVKGVDKKRKYPDDRLISTLTAQDGTFLLSYLQSELLELSDVKPALYLQVFDRDGKLIYTSPNAIQFQSGTSGSVTLEISEELLENHRSRPLGLEVRRGHLLSRGKLTSIHRTIELLATPGTPEYDRFLNISLCTLPPIDHFESFLDDAWDVLDGNVGAEQRFQDLLYILERSFIKKHINSAQQMEGQFSDLLQSSNDKGHSAITESKVDSVNTKKAGGQQLQELADKLARRAAGLTQVEALLGGEAIIPIVLATVIVAGPDPDRLDHYLGVIFNQIEAYRPASILHHASNIALTFGERGLGHFQAVLHTFEAWCLPGEIPSELPEQLPPWDYEEAEHAGCTAIAARAIPEILKHLFHDRTSGETYTIESVSPRRACAGERIIIQGSGFTSWGSVRFTGSPLTRGTPVDAPSVEWSDTRIVVDVPEEAGCGPITLRIPVRRRTFNVCDAFHDLSTYRTTTSEVHFEGCKPRILSFFIDGHRSCARHHSPATLHWQVYPPDAIVHIEQIIGGTSFRYLVYGAAPAGSISVDTDSTGSREFRITVRDSNYSCDAVSRRIPFEVVPVPTLTILGVEVTQGVQRFNLNDPSDPINNSLPLIAEMDTVVRVFVSTTYDGPAPERERITGSLSFGGRSFGPINGSPPGSSPFIEAKEFPDRRATDDSLNFLIPAGHAHGNGDLEIQVFTDRRCDEFFSSSHTQPISFNERSAFPVTIRRIADPGIDRVVEDDEALRILMSAFRMLPSPRSEIRLMPGVFSIHLGTAEANYCHDEGLHQLCLSVAYEHNGVEGVWPDPHESIWIGIFFQEDCDYGGIMAQPWTSTCISMRWSPSAAHEIVHCIGLSHTYTGIEPCHTDPTRSCQELPNNGQLTDVAFLIDENQVLLDAFDIMSYRPDRFTHPDHWEWIRELMDGRFG